MTFQNSLTMEEREPQTYDVKNLMVSSVAPQIHKELALFYIERQRSLQRIFSPEVIASKVDQVCDSDLLVRKLLADVEAD